MCRAAAPADNKIHSSQVRAKDQAEAPKRHLGRGRSRSALASVGRILPLLGGLPVPSAAFSQKTRKLAEATRRN